MWNLTAAQRAFMLGKPEEKSKGKKASTPLLTKDDLKRYEQKILAEEKPPTARIGDDQLEPPADLVIRSA